MSWIAAGLLLTGLAPAADPLALTGPQLARGDELVYTGEIVETGDRIDNRFRKKYEIAVRVFVLDVRRGHADCGVLTSVRPLDDALVVDAQVIASGAGGGRKPSAAAVRIDLIRVDDRGGVKVLAPKIGPPPLPLDKDTPAADPPPPPTDTVPLVELGAFVPLPITAVRTGDTWDVSETARPPLVWTAKDGVIWNGRRCVEATAVQQTDGYDQPDKVRVGWKRTDSVLVSPADGFASTVTRTLVRRDGGDRVGSVTVRYELQPSNKHAGGKYADTRAEVEAGWAFAARHGEWVKAKFRPDEMRARVTEIDRYLDERPANTPYRVAVEAVKRRYEAGADGAAPPVAAISKKVIVTLVDQGPKVGQPAADFVAPDVDKPTGRVRLSGGRGKPAVLAFFKPGSDTSRDTLTVCEALHRKYAGELTVIPLAVFGTAADAAKQRAALKLTVPVYDGAEVRSTYAVESFPQFFVVDGKGTLTWAFDAGIGPEVGWLVKQEVEKVR